MDEQDELAHLKDLVRRMAAAERRYGCGFYNYGPWCDAYDELCSLCDCETVKPNA